MAGRWLNNSMNWRWASASVIGTSHVSHGGVLQDAYLVAKIGNGSIISIVSDGAGSAKYGAYGAWLTCRFLSIRFREWMKKNSELPSDENLVSWIEELRNRISEIATTRGSISRQFASTLAAIIVTPDQTITLHIGDSAVVGRKDGEWEVLCWPENGEYASTTYFVTDVPGPRLNIVRHEQGHDAFALFSDGVGDLAMSHSEMAAHTKFFDPMLRPVDTANSEGRLTELSSKLATYLASPSICERTDDDKTLILISGR